MSVIDEVLSILAASKSALELPTATNPPLATDWLMFWNVSAGRLEKIQASQVTGASTWIWIEDSWVVKDAGNLDTTLLEVNDVVYFKAIANAGDPLTIVGMTYTGTDKTLRSHYTQNQTIDL